MTETGASPHLVESSRNTTESLLLEVVDAAIEIAGADFGKVQLLDPQTRDLRIVAHRGFPPWWLEYWDRVSHGQGVCGTALERGDRVVVEDVERDAIFVGTQSLEIQRRAGVRAVQSTPIFASSGEPLGMFSTHYKSPGRPDARALRLLDLLGREAAAIIERARYEDLLRRSERRYRTLVDSTSAVVWASTSSGRHVEAQPSWMTFTGQAPQEILTTCWLDAVHPDDREQAAARWRSAVEARAPFSGVHRLRRADGAWRWMSVHAVPLDGASPATEEWFGMCLDVTEQQDQAESLRVAEERFRVALAESPAVLFEQDRELRYTWINNPTERFPAEVVLGRTDRDLLPAEDAALLTELKRRVLETGIATRTTVKISIGSELRHYDLRLEPLRDREGRVVGLPAASWDETATARLREALALSEARLSAIVSVSADAIVSIDEHQRITMFNRGAETIFGYSSAEVVGAPLDVLIPDRLRAAHRRHVERFADGEDSARHVAREVRVLGRRKSGQEFPADASISKVEVGGKRTLTVVLRDITEAKRAEREQRVLAALGTFGDGSLDHREIATRVADAVARALGDWCVLDLFDDAGRLLRAAAACGEPTGTLAAADLQRLAPEEDRSDFVWTFLDAKEPRVVTVIDETPAEEGRALGRARLFGAAHARSAVGVPLAARGRVLGALTVLSSCAERGYTEADAPLVAELGRRAAVAIDNSLLYRSAQRALQARDEVLSFVAHDLRNPLNTVVVAAAGLHRREGAPERRSQKPADVIHRAAMRMNRLVQDLVDVTRVDGGQLVLDARQVEPTWIVHEVEELQRPLLSAAGLELALDVAAELPPVSADLDRVLQVFENLVGNAIKFTPTGGRVTVSAHTTDGAVVFCVSNTGSFIPEEDLPHVFDRFWQGRRRDGRGAGLGLAIAKSVVDAHGGAIWVESDHDRGTGFFFTVPFATAVAESEPAGRS